MPAQGALAVCWAQKASDGVAGHRPPFHLRDCRLLLQAPTQDKRRRSGPPVCLAPRILRLCSRRGAARVRLFRTTVGQLCCRSVCSGPPLKHKTSPWLFTSGLVLWLSPRSCSREATSLRATSGVSLISAEAVPRWSGPRAASPGKSTSRRDFGSPSGERAAAQMPHIVAVCCLLGRSVSQRGSRRSPALRVCSCAVRPRSLLWAFSRKPTSDIVTVFHGLWLGRRRGTALSSATMPPPPACDADRAHTRGARLRLRPTQHRSRRTRDGPLQMIQTHTGQPGSLCLRRIAPDNRPSIPSTRRRAARGR
jgi:hypothetical protein